MTGEYRKSHENCQTCKKYYMQGGKCCENKKNCLFYENEPRGKIIRDTFIFLYSENAETTLIKYGEKIIFKDNKKEKDFEANIIKINYIDMKNGQISVEVEYHENDRPHCKKFKLFKVVN